MLSAFDVARYLVELSSPESPEKSCAVSPLSLQKLLYYCQGWSLAFTGRPLFSDAIEAWNFGPVVRVVYERFKGSSIALTPAYFDPRAEVSPADAAVIRLVFEKYAGVPPTELISMTHSEPAWAEAWARSPQMRYPSEALSLETMEDYFRGLARDRHVEITGGRPLMPSVEDTERGEEQLARGEGRPAAEVFEELRRRSLRRI